jgi:UDP:flavonoid glycosyltransferase YjiC (YdhE family)
LTPEYASNARELAGRMSKASDSLAKAVELIEDFARSKSFA